MLLLGVIAGNYPPVTLSCTSSFLTSTFIIDQWHAYAPRVLKKSYRDSSNLSKISVATVWQLHQPTVMRDIIEAVPANAPCAQKELGHHMAQHHALHVQPDSSLKIIWNVSIAEEENILRRCRTLARSAPQEQFRKGNRNHAPAAQPACMQIMLSTFARFVLLALYQMYQRLSFASPASPGNILHQNLSVVKTAFHRFIPILLRNLVRNVRLGNIPKRKHGCVPRALQDQKSTRCKQVAFRPMKLPRPCSKVSELDYVSPYYKESSGGLDSLTAHLMSAALTLLRAQWNAPQMPCKISHCQRYLVTPLI
jgi:hypothetical protein